MASYYIIEFITDYVATSLDIARGARFLHAADPKIIHGDLKAANVLVDNRFHAKIADFGLSAKKKDVGASGTPYWMVSDVPLWRQVVSSFIIITILSQNKSF